MTDTLAQYADASYGRRVPRWHLIAPHDPTYRARYDDWGEEGWKVFEAYSWCGERLYDLVGFEEQG